MKTIRGIIAAVLCGLALSACTDLGEKQLLKPSRARPDLGVRLQVAPAEDLPADVRGERNQLLRVILVKPGRPAAQAGIQVNDILLALDGTPVAGVNDSVGLMQRHRWGETVIVKILRDGQISEIPVALVP